MRPGQREFSVRYCAWIGVALILVAILAAKSFHGADAATLQWLAQRESGNKANARGKAGELGRYQLKAIAVKEVNRIHQTKWTHADALDPVKAPIIAGHYWDLCSQRAKVKTREGVHRIYRGLK